MLSIDQAAAEKILRSEAARVARDPGPAGWREKVERLSQLCSEGNSITHIAFLGTILLARSVQRRADVKWIKPKHAKNAPNAFSARTLSEKVLVPVSAELGIHIGATGPQPLNNQPYFRMTYLGDGTPVQKRAEPAFNYMLTLVREIEQMPDEAAARDALRAFISVRMRSAPEYIAQGNARRISAAELASIISEFVSENSEGGKRAQAVVAGMLSMPFGQSRVITDRINSPSRRYPGDVCVAAEGSRTDFSKAFEVKDKPVTETDIHIFVRKCIDFRVSDAAYVAVAGRQAPLRTIELQQWASDKGVALTIFQSWQPLVTQALFWISVPSFDGVSQAVIRIREQLIAIEAAPSTVNRWASLTTDFQEFA